MKRSTPPKRATPVTLPPPIFEAMEGLWKESFVRPVAPVNCRDGNCAALVRGCGIDPETGAPAFACAVHMPEGGVSFDVPAHT